ncbi:MAG: TonB-dependent receptor, partial [Cellvibrionales bacterium]|nr:TonB-dependent receptor [Cellvibrionales bacterium]
EALQRITGVSIDRSRGEGSKVTVRGFGPEYNMVTLNGRQMPTHSGDSRSFDFGDLASEGVAAVVVNKTGDASVPSGGIGSLINIISTKPLEAGYVRSFGLKAMYDTSIIETADIIPPQPEDILKVFDFGREGISPEISGIVSDTFLDDTLGVSLSLSYQKRNNADRNAGVSGWKTFLADANGPLYSAPMDSANGHTAGQIHHGRLSQSDWSEWFVENGMPNGLATTSLPQNLTYRVTSYEAERKNSQLTLQYRPIESLTTTIDYTYSGLEFGSDFNDLSAWFSGREASRQDSVWDNSSPNATPILYREERANNDYPVGQGSTGSRSQNNSFGVNFEWFATDRLQLELDHHQSLAKSGPQDNINGTGSLVTISSYNRCVSKAYFTEDLPILVLGMDSENCIAADELGDDTDRPIYSNDMIISGSVISNGRSRMDIDQTRFGGTFDFSDYTSIDFGLELTEITNETKSAVVQRNSWSGISDPGDLNIDALTRVDLSSAFDAVSGSDYEYLQSEAFHIDIETLSDLATTYPRNELDIWKGGSCPHPDNPNPNQIDYDGEFRNFYCASTNFTNEKWTTETTKSAYLQSTTDYDGIEFELFGYTLFTLDMPTNVRTGMRYEETDVLSTAYVPTPIGTAWEGGSEFTVRQEFLVEDMETGEDVLPEPKVSDGAYGVFLPNLDINVEISDDLVGRFSTSKTITRASYNLIKGGTTVNGQSYKYGNLSASSGNPNLRPIESRNLDLSLEWYYGDTDYFSVGYFKKDVRNFIGNETIGSQLLDVFVRIDENGEEIRGVPDVTTGDASEYVINANQAGLEVYDTAGIAKVMPGISVETPLLSDPELNDNAVFQLSRPINEKEAMVYGWEFNLQHNFGESGFGMIANYTKPWANVGYNNIITSKPCEEGSIADKVCVEPQFALVGLSESANLIAFYDKDGFSTRIAYNWRDDFYGGDGQDEGAAYDTKGNFIANNPQNTQAYGQIDLSATYEINDNLTIMLDGINVTDSTLRRYGREKSQVLGVSQNGPRYNLGLRYTF